MQRKVKFFTKIGDTDKLDEEINAWIESHNKELIDVKLAVDREDNGDYVKYTATVIYKDRNEAWHEIQSYSLLRQHGRQ